MTGRWVTARTNRARYGACAFCRRVWSALADGGRAITTHGPRVVKRFGEEVATGIRLMVAAGLSVSFIAKLVTDQVLGQLTQSQVKAAARLDALINSPNDSVALGAAKSVSYHPAGRVEGRPGFGGAGGGVGTITSGANQCKR